MNFSDQETALMRELQRDSSASLADLAQKCHMSQSTAWRKVQELEQSGIIRKRVAILDPAKAGCKLAVLASITLTDHSEATLAGFGRLIEGHPEIVECLATSGQADYRMKIRVSDVEAYEQFMTHILLRAPFVREVHSSFVLKELKSTTELPL